MKLSNLIFAILIALFLILSAFNIWVIIKTNQTNKSLENVKFELNRIHNEVSVFNQDNLKVVSKE